MANPKFIFASTKAGFEAVKNDHFYDICFIDDTKQIYTHGKYYAMSPADVTALETLIATAQSTAEAAQTSANTKISAVSGSNAISVSGEGTSKTVSLLIDSTNAGNVTFAQTSAGLTASVDLSSVDNLVEGVDTNEKVLTLTSKKLATTLKIDYNSTTNKLQLKGVGDAVISDLDASAFIKDGMLDSVEIVQTAESGVETATPYLKFTFNTDSGKSVTRISLSSLIDIYNGENLNLTSNYEAASTYTAPTSGDSVNDAIGKLAKGIADLITASGDYATSTQGGYADSALQSITKGTDGTYVTTTIGSKTGNNGAKSQTVGVAVTVQAMSSADSTHQGLAEASDVKNYVDSSLAWVDIA